MEKYFIVIRVGEKNDNADGGLVRPISGCPWPTSSTEKGKSSLEACAICILPFSAFFSLLVHY